MTQDRIIELAREAGIPVETDWAGRPSTLVLKDGSTYLRGIDDLERFATLVRAQALEEVEKKVPGGKHTDKWESCRIADYNQGWNDYRKQCAAAIRALKEQTDMTAADYCAKCNAPKQWPAYCIRCGTCSVVNSKLPPTNYQPLKEKT